MASTGCARMAEPLRLPIVELSRLDRVRTHGREGFERTVGISILAANLHRLGRLLQQRAARWSHRTHAPPYRLAA